MQAALIRCVGVTKLVGNITNNNNNNNNNNSNNNNNNNNNNNTVDPQFNDMPRSVKIISLNRDIVIAEFLI